MPQSKRKQANPQHRDALLTPPQKSQMAPTGSHSRALSARATQPIPAAGNFKNKKARAPLATLDPNQIPSPSSPVQPRTLLPPTTLEPTTFFSLHHLFPKIWPEGRVAMGMATCKKLKSELRDLLVDCFPKTHEEWVEEFQHELDIMRQNVPGKRELHSTLLLQIKDQLSARYGVSVPVELEELCYEEKRSLPTEERFGKYPLPDAWNVSKKAEPFAQRFYAGCPSEHVLQSASTYSTVVAGYAISLDHNRCNPKRKAATQVEYSEQWHVDTASEEMQSRKAEEGFGTMQASPGLWAPFVRKVEEKVMPKAVITAEAMSVINDMMSDIFSRLAECASINARAAVFSGALASGPLDATALRAAAQHVLPQALFERAAALTSDALSHCERTSAFEDWPAQHERSGLAFSLRAVLAVLATTQQTGSGEARAVEQSQGRVCVGGVCVTAAVWAAAVLETVAQRVLECARQVSAAHVTTQSVFDAVCADADLAALLDGVSVFNRTVRAGFCSSSSDLPRANSIPRDDRDEAEASVACKWGVRHSMVPHAEFRAIVSAEWLWDFMSDFNADGDAIEALHCAAEAYMVEHFRTGPRAWKRPKLFHVEGADEAESQHSEEDEEEAFAEGDEEQEEELEEDEDEEEDEEGEEDEQ